jgi:hypothetical protein
VQIISKQTFDKNRIIKIKELSNGRIGILFEDSLLIENIKTSKKIDEIKLPVIMHYDEGIFDFIELKNSELILWSSKTIYVYQIIDDKYNLYQNINESEEEKEKSKKEEERIRYLNKEKEENDLKIEKIKEIKNLIKKEQIYRKNLEKKAELLEMKLKNEEIKNIYGDENDVNKNIELKNTNFMNNVNQVTFNVPKSTINAKLNFNYFSGTINDIEKEDKRVFVSPIKTKSPSHLVQLF